MNEAMLLVTLLASKQNQPKDEVFNAALGELSRQFEEIEFLMAQRDALLSSHTTKNP